MTRHRCWSWKPPNWVPPLVRSFLTTMSSQSTTIVIFFIASILILQYVSAQSSNEDIEWISDRFQRLARAPKPKFIRFGRAGAKFIRFGRSGANTWEDGYEAPAPQNEIYVKRGAKFIRFG